MLRLAIVGKQCVQTGWRFGFHHTLILGKRFIMELMHTVTHLACTVLPPYLES